MADRNPQRWRIWLGGAAAAVMGLIVGIVLSLRWPGCLLYLPAIALVSRTERSRDIYVTAAICSLLLIGQMNASALRSQAPSTIMEQAFGLGALWLTALLFDQRVRFQRRLLSQERSRRKLTHDALDALVLIDGQGKILDWNPQAERIFGWAAHEVLGHDMGELIVPAELRTAYRAGLERFWKTGTGRLIDQRSELTAVRRGGEVFPVEVRLVPVEIDEATLVYAYLRDITRRSEEAEYRRRMAALVDSSYDAIIAKDVTGKIISWNHGAELIYGYTEEEAVGQTVRLVLPPGVEQEEEAILQAVETGQRLEQFETVRRRRDGQLVPISATVSPITDDNGTVIGSSTIERDITDLKRNEEELREAKEAAEQAAQVRAEFLANVSHELRTPMNAIIGMTQLAMTEERPDDLRQYVQTANESAHSLLKLLNDILDFSKLESGKFSIEQEPFSLREMIDETVKALSSKASEKGLELACDVDISTPDRLVGDGVRLHQVLTNLINNAIKFTEQGEVVLSVETRHKWPHEARLCFAVRDTGVGISPEDQQRILEPFTQVDASSTRRYGGTGLGLAICVDLLHRMGSRLTVESEPGRGSRFAFEISLPRQVDRTKESFDLSPLQRLRNMRVLVVDDNQTNRQILSQTLHEWSMLPTEAGNGDEALRLLRQAHENGTPYSLVIVDAIMPEMDGYSLATAIRQQMREPPAVIIMVSLSDRREFRVHKLELQAELLQKPVSQSDLMAAVVRAMRLGIIPVAEEPGSHTGQVMPPSSLAVLLAEDTPANQRVVTMVLRKRGHTVTVAQNGREAVELFRRGQFDVVLMDVQMPIMDGFQATAAIRGWEQDHHGYTPIIAMTAHAMRGDRERCLEAGMDAYLSKPIDIDELVQVVEGAFASRHDQEHSASLTPAITESDARPDSRQSTVIDYAGTMQRLADDQELFQDFIRFFDEDSPMLLEKLREAIAAADAVAAQRAAHSLKGLAANFGAKSCVAVAQAVEELSQHSKISALIELMPRLEAEIQRVDRALHPYRPTPKA